jgi:hypothetical protein
MDALKEKIRYETERLRLMWATLVAAVGGTASLLLGGADLVRLGLVVAGMIAIVFLSIVSIRQDRNIRTLLEQLTQQEQSKEQRP